MDPDASASPPPPTGVNEEVRPPPGPSLANRHNALAFSANFIHPSSPSPPVPSHSGSADHFTTSKPSPTPSSSSARSPSVPLAHFMGGRTDLRGPYLTKSRVTEEEVRPQGWQAAEARARDAARTETRPAGLGGFISGKAPRALPGMVPNSRLTASPPPTFGTGDGRKEQEATTGPSVAAVTKSWGKPVGGGASRASTLPVQAMTLEERLRLDDEAKAAGGRATAPPTEFA